MVINDESSIAVRLSAIEERIRAACERVGRDRESVLLLAVSKGHDASQIEKAYRCGVRLFGESYVQEWVEKSALLPDDIEWHFVGRLQSNKIRFLADGPVACVQSIDRLAVARKLAARCAVAATRRGQPLNVMVEVNLGAETAKGGAGEHDAVALVEAIDADPALTVVGLMAIPPRCDRAEDARPYFRRLRVLRDALNENRTDEKAITHLSMGMSHDFDVAIEEGATIVRVGTAIFGPRALRRKG